MIELEIFPTKEVNNIFSKVKEDSLFNNYILNIPVHFANGKDITNGLIWRNDVTSNSTRKVSFQVLISSYLPKVIGINAFEIEDFISAHEILEEFGVEGLTAMKFQKVNYYFGINIPLLGSRESSIAIAISVVIAKLTDGLIHISNGNIPGFDANKLYSWKDFLDKSIMYELLKEIKE